MIVKVSSILFLALASLPVSSHAGNWLPLPNGEITKIAFGSCSNQYLQQPIWNTIVEAKPDLFLHLGDLIYGDAAPPGVHLIPPGVDVIEKMRMDYAFFGNKPSFKNLRENVPFMAVWDDHDLGLNDGGGDFPRKLESRNLLLDFLDVPTTSDRRVTPGLYESRIFGPEGRRVQVIMLDTRYFKGPFIQDKRSKQEKAATGYVGSMASYLPNDNPNVTLLGEQQWAWLEHQLNQPAEIRLIVSSTQVIADQKAMDEWGNYPLERQRLFDLINNTKGAIILSGNVHFSEISKTEVGGYELFDFTSSGLTHSNKAYAAVVNQYRVAGAYDELNFGLLEIDWDAESSLEIVMTAMTKNGEAAFSHTLILEQ